MIAALLLGIFYLAVTFLVGWYVVSPLVSWFADKLHRSAMNTYQLRQEQIAQDRTFKAAA